MFAAQSSSNSSIGNSRKDRSPKPKAAMIQAFDVGDFASFFRHWPSAIADRRDDVSMVHLDFYVRVYFATHRYRDSSIKTRSISNKAMEDLKAYLESAAGIELSKNSELMPYFGLPYVKNIERHPVFKDLKGEKWVSVIRRKLIDFLDTKYGPNDSGVQSANSSESTDGGRANVNESGLAAERRALFYRNRYTNLQANYHRLILVAAELVDALEQAIQGIEITPEQMEDLRNRLFDTRFNGTSLSARNQSTEDEDKPDDQPEMTNGTSHEAELKNAIPEVMVSQNQLQNPAIDPDYVDWRKIKERLLSSTGMETALLLQALRWCLTKCDDISSRTKVISAIDNEDLLSLGEKERYLLRDLVNSGICDIREQTLRFLNALSSTKFGRHYLLKSDHRFLAMFVENVCRKQFASNEAVIQSHGIAILQKCSVRRGVQIQLVRLGVLNWLIEYLQINYKSLPEDVLEYGTALLMNLSLTSLGKKAAAGDPEQILNLLNDLMNHEKAGLIAPYINGTLFSVLSLAHVRHKAKKLGLCTVLDKVLQRSRSPDDIQQIPYIIKQLNGELVDKQPPSSDEDVASLDDNGSEDSEDGTMTIGSQATGRTYEALEPELDEGDLLVPQSGLSGFVLLKSLYYKAAEPIDGNEKIPNGFSSKDTVAESKPPQREPVRGSPTSMKGSTLSRTLNGGKTTLLKRTPNRRMTLAVDSSDKDKQSKGRRAMLSSTTFVRGTRSNSSYSTNSNANHRNLTVQSGGDKGKSNEIIMVEPVEANGADKTSQTGPIPGKKSMIDLKPALQIISDKD